MSDEFAFRGEDGWWGLGRTFAFGWVVEVVYLTLSADGRAFLSYSFAWAVCASGELGLDVIFDFTLHDVQF